MAVIAVNNNQLALDECWDDIDNDEGCQICFAPVNPDSITLKCNHTFCYDCLLESYKGKSCNFSNSKVHRICPYCRSPASFLPLKPGMKPIKGIHRNVTKRMTAKTSGLSIPNQCKAIIKSGPNKGLKCVCQAKLNGFCGRHQNN